MATGQAFTWGCDDKSESESRSCDNEVTSSGIDEHSSRVRTTDHEYYRAPILGFSFSRSFTFTPRVASDQFRREQYSVCVNRGEQLRTYDVNSGGVR